MAGTPSSQGPHMVPAENFEAEILSAPNAPKQNFGCQPQTLEGEEGGGVQGGGGVPPSSYGVRPFQYIPALHPLPMPEAVRLRAKSPSASASGSPGCICCSNYPLGMVRGHSLKGKREMLCRRRGPFCGAGAGAVLGASADGTLMHERGNDATDSEERGASRYGAWSRNFAMGDHSTPPPRSGHRNCRNVPERFAGTL